MARLQLIIPLLLWSLWSTAAPPPRELWTTPAEGTAIYLAAVAGVVIGMAVLARRVMRRTTVDQADAVPRFHRAAFVARWSILLLHAAALWGLGFGDAVLQSIGRWAEQLPSIPAFVSLLPVVVAWMGLMAAQYPLDRAVREQNAVYAFEFGEPVRAVPSRRLYLLNGLRTQVLFTLVPLFTLAILRDAIACWLDTFTRLSSDASGLIATLTGTTLLFVFAPELLRRVLPTTSLPPSAVRDRLLGLSRSLKLGVRDVLLWHTHYATGNAAVMGIVPGVRYILMTDLLLESMPPEQVESVFAHEAGHVVHRHIAWYTAFWVAMLLWTDVVGRYVGQVFKLDPSTVDWLVGGGGLVLIILLFGWLSRGFERQADLFAAHWIDRQSKDGAPERDGAAVFAAALRNVARMNNLPLDAHGMTAGRPFFGRVIGRMAHHAATWLHGGIRSRIDHVAALTSDQNAARRFQRKMLVIRWVLAVLLATAIAFNAATWHDATAATHQSERENELDFHGRVARQRVHADGRPSVPAAVAEELG